MEIVSLLFLWNNRALYLLSEMGCIFKNANCWRYFQSLPKLDYTDLGSNATVFY